MRHRILPAAAAALLLVLGAAAPAFAGGGLPVLTSLKAGSTEVTIYGDSLFVHTGTNTLTLEVSGLPHGTALDLRLTGPAGEVVQVPVSTLHVVAGPADSHDAHGAAPAAADSHDAHGAAPAANSHDAHGAAPAGDAEWFRGKAKVSTTGTWKAELTVGGKTVHDELKVVAGGPNKAYLAFTGLAMGGTIIYGAIQRRKQGRA